MKQKLVAAALLVCIAGCGGDGDGEAVTVTETVTGTPTQPTTTTPSGGDISLSAYLAAMGELNDEYVEISCEAERAVEALDEDVAGATWVAAANDLEEVETSLDSLIAKMIDIDAPEALSEAHTGYAKSLQLLVQQLDEIGAELHEQDEPGVRSYLENEAPALASRSRELRNDWRIAVTTEGRHAAVAVPDWVNGVGKRRSGSACA